MAPRKPKKTQAPPSRRRYEAKNPVVSVRVPQKLYDALVEFKKNTGLSMADVLKIGLEKAKPDLETAWLQGAEEGYEIGYGVAQSEYEVSYWCGRCRRFHLSITTADEKKDAANLMYKAGWHDPNCRIS